MIDEDRIAAPEGEVARLRALLVQQAVQTTYCRLGISSSLQDGTPSRNYPGRSIWWDYLTNDARAALASGEAI